MHQKLYVDFETRSTADLKSCGVHAYAQTPTTSILCLGFAFDQEPVRIALGKKLPLSIESHVLNGGKVIAHNASFELTLWNLLGVPRYGWPELKLEQVSCTMVRAYAMGLPGSLERAAAAVGLGMKKDAKGQRLMLKLCQPRHTKDGSLRWWDDPADFKALYRYCAQDVEVERALDRRLLELTPFEKEVWMADQAINNRGVLVAHAPARIARDLVAVEQKRLNNEIRTVSGGRVASVNAHTQLRTFLNDCGVPVLGVAKADVSTVLERRDIPAVVRRVLEIRQEGAKSSTRKLDAMIEGSCSDGRMRGLFQYHAAGTGRWGGRRVQPQNFPRPKLKQPAIEEVFEMLMGNDAANDIRFWHGSPIGVISESLRGFFVAAPGRKLMAMDYSAIEARVLAWLAGQESTLEIFRTHGQIYEAAAAAIFGIAIEDVTPEQRQVGKVAVLALGYQGGVGAFQTMARGYGVKMGPAFDYLWAKARPSDQKYALKRWEQVNDEREITISKREWLASELTKLAWRAAHPQIVEYWSDVEEGVKKAIRAPGQAVHVGPPGRQVTFLTKGSFLFCRLPSGRSITYAYPSIREEETKWGSIRESIKYMATNSVTNKWERHTAYGGLLVENITQAVARDLLAAAMLRCEREGFPVVLTCHDEVVCETEMHQPLERLKEIVEELPPWAVGLPIAAEGWQNFRYRK